MNIDFFNSERLLFFESESSFNIFLLKLDKKIIDSQKLKILNWAVISINAKVIWSKSWLRYFKIEHQEDNIIYKWNEQSLSEFINDSNLQEQVKVELTNKLLVNSKNNVLMVRIDGKDKEINEKVLSENMPAIINNLSVLFDVYRYIESWYDEMSSTDYIWESDITELLNSENKQKRVKSEIPWNKDYFVWIEKYIWLAIAWNLYWVEELYYLFKWLNIYNKKERKKFDDLFRKHAKKILEKMKPIF